MTVRARIHVSEFLFLFIILTMMPSSFVAPNALAQTPSTHPADPQQRIDERLRLQQEEERRRIQRLIEQFADRTREVATALDELAKKAEALDVRMKALLTNDDGKRVAADQPAFEGFMQALEQPLVRPERITTRKKSVDSILAGLQEELQRPSAGYLPGEASRREVEEAASWTSDRLAAINTQTAWFDTAISNAPKDLDLSRRTTLEEAIKRFKADEREAYHRAVTESRDEARREMEKLLRDTAKQAQKEEETAKAERLLRESRAEQERQRIEYETRLKAMEAELKRQSIEAEIRHKDLMAELERTRQLAEARRNADDVATDIEKQKIEDAAEKQKHIQQCRDPAIQQVLAPFLTKGYWQPGDRSGANIDLKPMSYSKLTAFGALQPTATGVRKLLQVGTNDGHVGGLDKVRPRWPYNPDIKRLKPEQLEEVKKAQAYLIELGPTMVELGMLEK